MFTIRPATIQDIELIRELASKTWFITYKDILSIEQASYMFDWMYSAESIRNQMEEKNHQFFIASREDKPIGYVSIGKEEEGLFHLHKLYILPDNQGDGTGKKLLQFVFETAREQSGGKPCSVELNVNRYNKAVSFYKKMGMHVHTEGNFDIGSGYLMTDYIMRIDL